MNTLRQIVSTVQQRIVGIGSLQNTLKQKLGHALAAKQRSAQCVMGRPMSKVNVHKTKTQRCSYRLQRRMDIKDAMNVKQLWS